MRKPFVVLAMVVVMVESSQFMAAICCEVAALVWVFEGVVFPAQALHTSSTAISVYRLSCVIPTSYVVPLWWLSLHPLCNERWKMRSIEFA